MYHFYVLTSILLVLCNFNLSLKIGAINDNINKCTARVVEKIFGREEVLYLIFENDDYPDALPFAVPNPKVIVNATRANIHVTSEYNIEHITHPLPNTFRYNGSSSAKYERVSSEYGRNFIICTKNVTTLKKIMVYLENSSIWNNNESPRGTFLVLSEAMEYKSMFLMFWKLFIRHVAILAFNKDDIQTVPILYTANPHDPGNCGTRCVSVYSEQLCDHPVLQFSFQKSLKNYNKYPIRIHRDDVWLFKKITCSNFARITVNALQRYYNLDVVEFRLTYILNQVQLHLIIKTKRLDSLQKSHTLLSDNFVFLVPLPERISGLEIYVFVFQKELWIMVFAGFFLTVVVWLGIQGINKSEFFCNIALVSLNVFSITIWGSISSVPKRFALRFVFLAYVIYCIHIQTAYVSMLIRVLTIPQFEKGIETLEELAESDVMVCLEEQLRLSHFLRPMPENDLYTKIQKKILPDLRFTPILIYDEILRYNNCSTAATDRYLIEWMDFRKVSVANTIIPAQLLMGSFHCKFGMVKGHYLMDTLNEVISTLRESGFYSKLENDMNEYYRKMEEDVKTIPEIPALSLDHLYGLFVIWGFCVLISVLVFFLILIISIVDHRNCPGGT